jgi:hypothetical protein
MDMGCPDCRGVLYVTELGHHGFLWFHCRVGQAFSSDAVVELNEDRLDEALWTALELFEEIVHARTLRTLIRREGTAPGARRRKKVSVA